jgi:hypothetical protein
VIDPNDLHTLFCMALPLFMAAPFIIAFGKHSSGWQA